MPGRRKSGALGRRKPVGALAPGPVGSDAAKSRGQVGAAQSRGLVGAM
jgi:hypothetical protein